MTPVAIAWVQVLCLTVLIVPMGAPGLGLPRGTRMGMGYLAANALALLIGYTLDMLGIFSAPRMFATWLAACLFLNWLTWPGRRRRHSSPANRGERGVYGLLAAVLALTAWIRLADPVQNIALAGIDSYHFVNFCSWILGSGKAIHDYPSGFALLTCMAPWTIHPYEVVRWGPHLVFLACQAAAFGFWRRLAGLRFAWFLTLLLGTAWFLYPFTGLYPHFIQWTTGLVCIPALLFIYSRFIRGATLPLVLLGGMVNLVFVFTSAYFALSVNGVLGILTALAVWRAGRRLNILVSATGIALVPLVTLLLFYGILTRFFFAEWNTGIAVQSAHIRTASQPVAGEATSVAAPAGSNLQWIRVITDFLLPRHPLQPGLRWLVYAGLGALGFWVWRRSRAPRHLAAHLLGGLVLVSVLSAATGILELPGWEGRNVFIALYGGTAAALWAALRCFPAPARRIFRTPGLWLLFIALVAGPSLFWPPMIGRNIPVAPAIHPRLLPVDNRVLAELTRVPEVGRPPPTLAFLPYSVPPDRLVANLQRLRAHTLRDCFPAYRFIPTNDWAAACQQDALLASRAWLADHSLPGDFEVREEGPDFILAFRKPPQNP